MFARTKFMFARTKKFPPPCGTPIFQNKNRCVSPHNQHNQRPIFAPQKNPFLQDEKWKLK